MNGWHNKIVKDDIKEIERLFLQISSSITQLNKNVLHQALEQKGTNLPPHIAWKSKNLILTGLVSCKAWENGPEL